ncbi:hypothetical protein CK203_034781 [Vitis vinifera]|uniref:GOST seven transmembrane domain-containing protein n=1 Tax=Vitis vinifera TaxID=29760 RepID=A0A438IC93_VITVI|nr:hypothetical protein CK203_034781 [Vitis vinifera]
MRRSMAKLELYRKFTNSLAVSVVLSIAWIGYEVVFPPCSLLQLLLVQLYFNASDPSSEPWEIAWIIPAFWNLLSFALLIVICILWAPTRNPTRYTL